MDILLDANILVRLANALDPQRHIVLDALQELHGKGHDPVIVPQALYEYWVVATRPIALNGLALSAEQASQDLARLRLDYRLLQDDSRILDHWQDLVTSHAIVGKRAHDARLVAAMLRHGVTHLLTFNAQDFTRFPEVTAVLPQAAAGLPHA